MQKKEIYITDLDFDYKLWKNKLRFYQNELSIYHHRLEEIQAESANKPIEPEINSFKKSLYHLQQETQKVEKTILTNEAEISCFVDDYPITAQHDHFKEHHQVRKEMNSLEVHIKALKDDLMDEMSDDLFFDSP